MSHSSTSSSSLFTWKRLRREILRVVVLLLVLEVLCHVEPIHRFLSDNLDPYENLLWYDMSLPAYRAQLETNPNYTVWLLGSSYMMTGLNPKAIQADLQQQGLSDFTAQNYGMNRMMNLAVMGDVFDRWMFTMGRPQYIVLGIAWPNFAIGANEPPPILNSPYENLYLFPDSPSDYAAGFLFKNSLLFRYTILARNAMTIPADQTIAEPPPTGGYVSRPGKFTCPQSAAEAAAETDVSATDLQGGLAHLDHFIDVIRAHDIPVFVVNIPIPQCTLVKRGLATFEDYQAQYLNPIAEHLQDENIPFLELDTRFRAEVPENEQMNYFANHTHPNKDGAALFSQWTADAVAEWVKTLNNPH